MSQRGSRVGNRVSTQFGEGNVSNFDTFVAKHFSNFGISFQDRSVADIVENNAVVDTVKNRPVSRLPGADFAVLEFSLSDIACNAEDADYPTIRVAQRTACGQETASAADCRQGFFGTPDAVVGHGLSVIAQDPLGILGRENFAIIAPK